MRYIKSFINFFTTITTAVLIVCAVLFSLSEGYVITVELLYQVLISGASTALVSMVFFTNEYRSVRSYAICTAVHFVLICALMLTLGTWFGWISPKPSGVVLMVAAVAVVYAVTWTVTWLNTKREADALNRALDERNRK